MSSTFLLAAKVEAIGPTWRALVPHLQCLGEILGVQETVRMQVVLCSQKHETTKHDETTTCALEYMCIMYG